eukprot:NODE_153_length_15389_cov_1.201439.p7 type:complete len:263 gc:universal NODE_153_length_15389_cov_1.201439:8372-9160(+)
MVLCLKLLKNKLLPLMATYYASVDINGIDVEEDLAKAIVDPIFKSSDLHRTAQYLRSLGVQAIFTKDGDHLDIQCKEMKKLKLGVGTEVSQQDVTLGLSLVANNLRKRLDNLQFKANFGQWTRGLFELQYKIPLQSNLLSRMVHSLRFGNITMPTKMYERSVTSKYIVEHESLPLTYSIGPEISLRDHLEYSQMGGVGHEVAFDSRDKALPSKGINFKIGQFIGMWEPHTFVKNYCYFSITKSLFNLVPLFHLEFASHYSSK